MKQSKLFHLMFPFTMLAIPWVYLAYIWDRLPQTIPVHFGLDGLPDRFGNKRELIWIMIILTAVALLIYFLLMNIHKIDPKKKYTASTSGVMKKISMVIIILLSFLSVFILYSTLHAKTTGMPLLFCGLSLFLAYLGNLMHSIKPNYFAGFRIPWTLENEDNWKKTHRLASKIWFAGGIILAVISLLLPVKLVIIVFLVAVLIMSIIPVVYSYRLFKSSSK
jgi:uncharacterized membrane protein